MSDLTHLFKVGQKVYVVMDGGRYKGTIKETYSDHIIVDVPEVCDHCYFDQGLLDMVYPEYNFD